MFSARNRVAVENVAVTASVAPAGMVASILNGTIQRWKPVTS